MRGRRHRDREDVLDILCFLERIGKTIANKRKSLTGMWDSRGSGNPYGRADFAISMLERRLEAAILDLRTADREIAEDEGK